MSLKSKSYLPIHLALFAIDAHHEAGYTLDRREGDDSYLFEYFESPVLVQDERERQRYEGSVFILYAPGQRHYFRAEEPLTHTWFQVAGAGVRECIERYNIPVNRATQTTDLRFLAPLLEAAQRHQVRRHRYWEDAVTETFRALFRRLSRALYQGDQAEPSPYREQLLATMYAVRRQVHQDLKRRWTVEDMAALANMSAQRFSVVYRSCFGTGPIDDLIDVRLRYADLLLRHLPITVLDAAHHSGFNSGSNFHVLFRERMHRSPRSRSRPGERLQTLYLSDLFNSTEEAQRASLLYFQPVAYWSFDGDAESVTDDLGMHPALEMHHAVMRVAGRHGAWALHFDGASHALAPETMLDTSCSYTVCAWLNHSRHGRMTAISIGDANHGAFYLQYIPEDGGFKLAATVSRRDPMAIFVVGNTPSENGEWMHVAGVHDAERREIRLYVNGRLDGRTAYETPWRAEGATYFGCCQVRNTIIDHWDGAIDDVRFYSQALSDAEIALICRAESVAVMEAGEEGETDAFDGRSGSHHGD